MGRCPFELIVSVGNSWAELVWRYLLEVTNTVNRSSIPGSFDPRISRSKKLLEPNPNHNPNPSPRNRCSCLKLLTLNLTLTLTVRSQTVNPSSIPGLFTIFSPNPPLGYVIAPALDCYVMLTIDHPNPIATFNPNPNPESTRTLVILTLNQPGP